MPRTEARDAAVAAEAALAPAPALARAAAERDAARKIRIRTKIDQNKEKSTHLGFLRRVLFA